MVVSRSLFARQFGLASIEGRREGTGRIRQDFLRKLRVVSCVLCVKGLDFLGVSAAKSLRHRCRCRELRRLTHNFSRTLRYRLLQRVIGAVGHFGHNVHWIEMLPHHRLREASAELDS